jgi:hypothetical protein
MTIEFIKKIRIGFQTVAATALRLEMFCRLSPGLKQPWALGRHRFAVKHRPNPQPLISNPDLSNP